MGLDCYRPFVFDVRGQQMAFCGVGLCDPTLIANVNAIQGFVYQHGLFQWTLDRGDGGTGNITLASGAEVDLFTTGIGDLIPGGWWTQGPPDTNNLQKKNGAMVDRNYVFIARGLMADVPEAFARQDASATSARISPQWMQNADDGAGYAMQMQKAQLNNTALFLRQSDTGCTFRIGLLKHVPGWVGPSGPQTVRNGLIAGPWFVPFSIAFCFGSTDDIRQISLQAIFGQAFVVENNGSQPTVATSDNILYQPFEITIIGNICYVPDIFACGTSCGPVAQQGASQYFPNYPAPAPASPPTATAPAPMMLPPSAPAAPTCPAGYFWSAQVNQCVQRPG